MELTDAVHRRRMTRNFSGKPVDRRVVDHLLDDALRAPSAGNTQGRELVVLEGPAQTAAYWDTTTDAAWRARSSRFAGLSRAPVIVLPFADPDAYLDRYRQPDKARPDGVEVEWVVPFWFVDAAYATMTLLLGATDQGLGAAFLGNFRGEDDLRNRLGVPTQYRCCSASLPNLTPRPPRWPGDGGPSTRWCTGGAGSSDRGSGKGGVGCPARSPEGPGATVEGPIRPRPPVAGRRSLNPPWSPPCTPLPPSTIGARSPSTVPIPPRPTSSTPTPVSASWSGRTR